MAISTLTVTGIVIAIAGLTVWQGSAIIAKRAAAVEAPPATERIAVSVSPIQFEDAYTVDRSFTGQIESAQTAALSFEQGGTLQTVLVNDGDFVAAGDVVAQLDDRLLKADLDRLKASRQALMAQLELAQLTDERQVKLKERGFASAQTADQTRLSIVELNARLAEIDVAMLIAQIQLTKAEIRAPFDGKVNERLIDPGNTVGAAQPVLTLVETAAPVFRVGIAPDLASQIQLGQKLTIKLSGTPHEASVIAILPQIDPVTRTRIVRAQLEGENDVAFGMTGEAALKERIETPGSWLPLTAIEDGVRGLWTIKTVSETEPYIVEIEAVEIIHADGMRAYVRGTFSATTRYIDEGIHRVVAGQEVRVLDQ